jgi:hypothetical protein
MSRFARGIAHQRDHCRKEVRFRPRVSQAVNGEQACWKFGQSGSGVQIPPKLDDQRELHPCFARVLVSDWGDFLSVAFPAAVLAARRRVASQSATQPL